MPDSRKDILKNKFLEEGLESFSEREILDFLLLYSSSAKGTTKMSDTLINSFGNLCKVFDSNVDLLREVNKLSDNSIVLFRMIPELCHKYLNYKFIPYNFKELSGFEKFAINQYIGIYEEIMKAIFLGDNMEFISCDYICTCHNISQVILRLKKIVERAESHKSFKVILMHNHPSGNTNPSNYDKLSTSLALNLLASVEVELMDHVIVSKKGVLSMKNEGLLR